MAVPLKAKILSELSMNQNVQEGVGEIHSSAKVPILDLFDNVLHTFQFELWKMNIGIKGLEIEDWSIPSVLFG
jgi:hypothetical protein